MQHPIKIAVDAESRQIMQAFIDAGGRPFIVGGFVRDQIMGIDSKDVDFEVFGMNGQAIIAIARSFGEVIIPENGFGAISMWSFASGRQFDIARPRRDRKNAIGHSGFIIDIDDDMSMEEAARRRDITINAIFADIDGNVIDVVGGVADIQNGIIRPVDAAAFSDDVVRAMRVFQFMGRFAGFVMTPECAKAIAAVAHEAPSMSRARVWGEWKKWAEKSVQPSASIRAIMVCGWGHVFPEIAAMVGVEQDAEWHPEGDVFQHACHAVDAMARICDRDHVEDEDRVAAIFGAFCHDMGKAVPGISRRDDRGRIVSHGHEQAGVEPARAFMRRCGAVSRIIVRVERAAEHHMRWHGVVANPRNVRRMSMDFAPASIAEIARVAEADQHARPPRVGFAPMAAFVEMAHDHEIKDAKAQRIIQGRHIDHVFQRVAPGPERANIINAAFEAQIEGEFDNVIDGVAWVERFVQAQGIA